MTLYQLIGSMKAEHLQIVLKVCHDSKIPLLYPTQPVLKNQH